MRTILLPVLFTAILMTTSSGFARQGQVELLFSLKEKNRFLAEVEYSKQDDGREHCALHKRAYDPDISITLIVPGDRNEVAVIGLHLTSGLFGWEEPPESEAFRFYFVKRDGTPTENSALGVWNFPIREINRNDGLISYVLAQRVDGFWGLARDWYDSAAVFVTNEEGQDVTSMTLFRSQEIIQALADCWSGTEGE